jgi:hypothetical protein
MEAVKRHRTGFMTLLAIALLALVSAALVGMSALFAQEIDSARMAGSGAQMRQLLRAGEDMARDQADRWANRPGAFDEEVKLPKALQEDSARVHVRLLSQDPVYASVEAVWHGRRQMRRIRFERIDGSWQMRGKQDAQ